MPSLLDLPNELLYQTIRYIEPQDIEAFTLSCKHTHGLAKDAYNDYKKPFSTLSYSPSHDTEENIWRDPRLFLQSISVNPHLAYWPTVLQCDYNSAHEGETENCWPGRHDTNSILSGLDLKAGMSHVSAPRLSRISAVWCLITLLQNLTSLTLESESLAGSILADIVERVAEANRDPTSPSHGKALTKLRTLSATTYTPKESAHINFYRSFAMLPSMRSLRGCMSDGREMGCRWPESFQPGSSMVTTIQLGFSAVAAHNFEALFGGIAALKHFTYEYVSVGRGSGPYEPVGIIDALRLHAYHSLKSLSITRIDGDYKWEARTVGPLHTFTSLKSIRLEDVLFAIPWPDDRSSEDDSSWGDYGDWPRQPYVMGRLVDLLPASLKAFTLVQLMYDKQTRDLLEGLAELKEIKVPKLTRLTVGSPNLFDQEMKDSLKSAGIKLWSWNDPI